MPSLKVHCAISRERTKGTNDFKELHEWIDEPMKWLKHNHRIERHSYNDDYEKFISNKWTEKAVVEWLFHISLDNIETAHKFAEKYYNRSYDEIDIKFKDKEIHSCSFVKDHPNSKSWSTYTKNVKNIPGQSFGQKLKNDTN